MKQEDGLEALWNLRKKVAAEGKLLTRKQIQELMSESKKEWDRFE